MQEKKVFRHETVLVDRGQSRSIEDLKFEHTASETKFEKVDQKANEFFVKKIFTEQNQVKQEIFLPKFLLW